MMTAETTVVPLSSPLSDSPPALPERSAWPWARLCAVACHLLTAVVLYGLPFEALSKVYAYMVILLASVLAGWVLSLVYTVNGRPFLSRVSKLGGLLSGALLGIEVAAYAGAWIFIGLWYSVFLR